MNTTKHAAIETGRWVFGITVILVALAIAAIAALFIGAFAWFFAKALIGEWKLWLVIGVLFVAAIAWAAIKDDLDHG